MTDPAAVLAATLPEYALPVTGFHGVGHWARVLENGLRIADANGADREVVTLFASSHDARRVNDGHDPGHGRRGGELARTLRGTLVPLDDAQFELLFDACARHTDGGTTADPTVGACWDADRPDLGRVGITPSAAGRALMAWADARAVAEYEPVGGLRAWAAPGW